MSSISGGLTSADISYYLDFQYDAEQLLSWYHHNSHQQQPWPGRNYNILGYHIIAQDCETQLNYPLALLRQFQQRYDIPTDDSSCQFVQIPAGHLMPLHTDTYARKHAVIFPLTGSTPTVFCNKVGRYITEVQHIEHVPVLLRADIPHKTLALPEQDKINYQISFKYPPGNTTRFDQYANVLDKIRRADKMSKH